MYASLYKLLKFVVTFAHSIPKDQVKLEEVTVAAIAALIVWIS
jgi:hypothetical protein